MKVRLRRLALVIAISATTAFAQMHGGSGGGMGSSGGGMNGSGGMGGSGSGMSMGSGSMSHSGMANSDQQGTAMTPMQRRQLMHTTTQQQQQYANCKQRADAVQQDITHMMHSTSGSSATNSSADASAGGDDGQGLSGDVADLTQDDDSLVSGMNKDQTAALTSQIKNLQKSTKEMEELAQQIKAEMAAQGNDPKKVQRDLKKLQKLAKDVAKKQRDIATALGIEA